MQDSLPAINVVLLAGSRPGGDPLALAAGVTTKALVPIAGQTMLARTARTLINHPRIATVAIVAQQGADMLAGGDDTGWLADHARIRFVESNSGISQSLLDLIDGGALSLPLLVTTVDNVLLNNAIMDHFLNGLSADSDIAVGMVERTTLHAAYPQSRRTWLKFRGGWWSGANLFWLGSSKARTALALWRNVEQDRKKGWKILSAFGPSLLLGALLRILTIESAIAKAGRRLNLKAEIVPLPVAEACIDADKSDDIALIEAILAHHQIDSN
jgi:molybdopterin-guanine dinucleotide biosynthesis protein A